MLSPVMPFLTEELWHAVYDGKPPAKSIALTRYPQPTGAGKPAAIEQMELLQGVIVEVRGLRKEIGVEEKAAVPIEVRTDPALRSILESNSAIVERLARVSEVAARRSGLGRLVEASHGRLRRCCYLRTHH